MLSILVVLVLVFNLTLASDQIQFYVVCDSQILEKPLVNVIVEPNQPKDLIKEKQSLAGGLQSLKSELNRPLYTIEVACPGNEDNPAKRQKHWIQNRDQSQVKKSDKQQQEECLYLFGNKNTKRYAPCPPAGKPKAGAPIINFDVLWMTKSTFSGYILCDSAKASKKFMELDDSSLDKGKLDLKEDGKFEIRFKRKMEKNSPVRVRVGCSAGEKGKAQTYELDWATYSNEHLLFNQIILMHGERHSIEYVDKRDAPVKI